jgi:site-specific DNA recombinase
MRLAQLYKNGTVKEDSEIIGSTFPENLTFDGECYRTARLNEAVP